MNVTVNWTLSGGDSADSYLINVTTNAPQTSYGGLVYTTTASVTLTGFVTGYEYNITVRGVNCGSLVGSESETLTITPQGKYNNTRVVILVVCIQCLSCSTKLSESKELDRVE